MRTIPVPQRNMVAPTQGSAVPQQAQTTNLRADAGALAAPAGALVQAGETIQGGAEMLGRFALEKQAQVNKGILAKEETIRMETAAAIQAEFDKNKDDPAMWGEINNKAWSAYEKGRSERSKKEKWGTAVEAHDKLAYENYRADTRIKFTAEQDKALVRQSNARLEANAQAKLRAGDYEGYVGEVDKMNLFPDQKEDAVRRGLEAGTYAIASNQLDALRSLPPKQAIDAITAFTEAVNAKGEDGKYKEYEYGRGGMTQGQRAQLTTQAQQRIREQERAMDVTGRAIVAQMRMGRATEADLANAVKLGQITEDTALAIMPDVAEALNEWEGKIAARREAADRRTQEKNQQQANATDRLTTSALRGHEGVRDIDQQLALGEISKEQAEKLKSNIVQLSKAEQLVDGPFKTLDTKLNSLLSGKLFNDAPEDAEYQAMQAEITAAKLTKESRLKLMDKLLQVKLSDVDDLQEEGPSGSWSDRSITPPERALRRDMLAQYRMLLPALGDVNAGAFLFSQEKEIRDFFDQAKPGTTRSEAEITKFLNEKLLPPVRDAAGYEPLKNAFSW